MNPAKSMQRQSKPGCSKQNAIMADELSSLSTPGSTSWRREVRFHRCDFVQSASTGVCYKTDWNNKLFDDTQLLTKVADCALVTQ